MKDKDYLKLRECPFCGSEAKLDSELHCVECNGALVCPVIPRTWGYDTDMEAVEAWNRRAGDET